MDKKYDVILVGAGPAGIFSAYELIKKDPTLKVLLVEKGNDIYSRKCPILAKKADKCPSTGTCYPSCSMTSGFGGCGAYSDGKFNITSEFGGWMTDYLSEEEVLDLIRYVDTINLEHGAPKELTDPYTKEVYDIERKGIAHGLKLLRSEVRHLGTEVNLQVLKNIYEDMKPRMDFLFATTVDELIVEEGTIKGIVLANGEKIFAEYVALCVGRAGSAWLTEVLSKHGVSLLTIK